MMTEAAEIAPRDHVLEIGAGASSGYTATVLARLAARVHTVERHRRLAENARRRLSGLGFGNVEVQHGDGTLGLPEEAPFDAIIVAAAAPAVPKALRARLAIGGRLIIPVRRNKGIQNLLRIRRTAPDQYKEEDHGGVAFVPLIGAESWAAGCLGGGVPWPER